MASTVRSWWTAVNSDRLTTLSLVCLCQIVIDWKPQHAVLHCANDDLVDGMSVRPDAQSNNEHI